MTAVDRAPEDAARSLVTSMAKQARAAARRLAPTDEATRDRALEILAGLLEQHAESLVDANREDVEQARAKGQTEALLDRLTLTAARVQAMARSVREVMALPSPVGELIDETQRPNGLRVRRVRVPLGVIAMIYEARPNVTVEAATLALKAGNAVLLRGGSEARRSNEALGRLIAQALETSGLPAAAVQIVPAGERESIKWLIQESDHVDLVIPRGGEALIRFVTENARVPVVQHYKGVCHAYLDQGADREMATRLVLNGKLQRPGVCNALEGLLVAESEVTRLLVPVAEALIAGGATLYGCEKTRAAVPAAQFATDEHWGTEYLEPKLSVRVVHDLDEALAYIARYGSGHSELIVTPDAGHAERFRREVDAACVLVNASSRFHDGGELGLGAELGIATSRLHWRGPMGLEALTTMKWLVDGDGQIR